MGGRALWVHGVSTSYKYVPKMSCDILNKILKYFLNFFFLCTERNISGSVIEYILLCSLNKEKTKYYEAGHHIIFNALTAKKLNNRYSN